MTALPLPRVATTERLPAGVDPRRTLARWFHGLRRWAQLRHDLKRLHELDDHILADIGLARSDIHRAVRGGYGTDERRGRTFPTPPNAR